MGFIPKTFDMKMMARKLIKKPAAPEKPVVEKTGGRTTVYDLNAYVFEHLFLPIVQYGCVPTEGLDFEKISDDDLYDLSKALHECGIFEFFNLGLAFQRMTPASSHKSTFI